MSDLSLVHVYQLKVWIQAISPMVWCRLLVRSDSTLADLHYTLQIAIGWSDTHLNRFHIHGKDYGVYHSGGISFADDPEQVSLSAFGFWPRERFLYEYDFGDAWLHEVRIEQRLSVDPKRTYPVCIDGKHAVPPEDCGGVLAYLQMRHELAYQARVGGHGREYDVDFNDEDEWDAEGVSEDRPIDPNVFSRREVNARLRQYARGDRDGLFSD